MPTRGRPEFALLALGSFLSQDYPNKELIIVDDADSPSFHSGVVLPSVRYFRVNGHPTTGAKRNLCCVQATGDIVMHFDDDDWSSPGRMSDQVRRLEESGLSVTAYQSMVFFDRSTFTAFRGRGANVLGTSLAYRRVWWDGHRFEDLMISEDGLFAKLAADSGQLSVDPGAGQMVARVHEGNTSKKHPENYRPVDRKDVAAGYPYR